MIGINLKYNTIPLRECICVYLPQCLCEHISVSNAAGSFQCLDSSRVFNGLATNDVLHSSQPGTSVIHIEGGRVPEGSHPVRGQGFSLGSKDCSTNQVVTLRLVPFFSLDFTIQTDLLTTYPDSDQMLP